MNTESHSVRTFKRLTRAATLRLCSWSLQALNPGVRAEVLESVKEDVITPVSVPTGQIRFHTPSPLLVSRATSMLSKETDTIRWIDGFEDRAVFWDVGANVGVYSLYAAARKRISVLSFEPLAANFHVLTNNINLNQLSDLITSYCIAFSGNTRLGFLNMASPEMGAAISQFGRPSEMSQYWDGQTRASMHGMVGFTIDDFVSQFDPPFPNHMKIDVDGLEVPILAGARKTLSDPRLRSLVVELSLSRDRERSEARSFLEEAGFHFISRGVTQGTETESAANHLFERLERPVVSAVG